MGPKESELVEECAPNKAQPRGQMFELLGAGAELSNSMRHQIRRLNDILQTVTGEYLEEPQFPEEPETIHGIANAINDANADNVTLLSDIVTKLEQAL